MTERMHTVKKTNKNKNRFLGDKKKKKNTDTEHRIVKPLLMLAIMLETALKRNDWV